MRTLTLLAAALLLLALQANAKSLRETDDQVPSQDLPEALDQDQLEAEDQNQLEAKGQNMSISFGGPNRLVQGASGLQRVSGCSCNRKRCRSSQIYGGICSINGVPYFLCCR
ncbi:defensin-5-like [Rhinolophus ferrumequinum]|uniref:defensin-5-like n=1 Tax=Rhinolophus ferrumequinum TaxID=59479 RepID=UPI00140FD470|nr:defensin-5-like [Rhinolophus ferrumequinum]